MLVVDVAAKPRPTVPICGAVPGIDVGWSERRRSSAACLLTWAERTIGVQLCLFTARATHVRDSLAALVHGKRCLAAAIDGPLARGFPEIGRYRTAEMMLTRAFRSTIGKPGQSSSPNGVLLNRAANQAAAILGQLACVGPAAHRCAIAGTAIVEAFPTAFLESCCSPTRQPGAAGNPVRTPIAST